MEVAKDGIALYEADNRDLAMPKPKTPELALAAAKEYFEEWYPTAGQFHGSAIHSISQGWLKKAARSEEHTSELQSLMRISYAVFCLKKKKQHKNITNNNDRIYTKQQ